MACFLLGYTIYRPLIKKGSVCVYNHKPILIGAVDFAVKSCLKPTNRLYTLIRCFYLDILATIVSVLMPIPFSLVAITLGVGHCHDLAEIRRWVSQACSQKRTTLIRPRLRSFAPDGQSQLYNRYQLLFDRFYNASNDHTRRASISRSEQSMLFRPRYIILYRQSRSQTFNHFFRLRK